MPQRMKDISKKRNLPAPDSLPPFPYSPMLLAFPDSQLPPMPDSPIPLMPDSPIPLMPDSPALPFPDYSQPLQPMPDSPVQPMPDSPALLPFPDSPMLLPFPDSPMLLPFPDSPVPPMPDSPIPPMPDFLIPPMAANGSSSLPTVKPDRTKKAIVLLTKKKRVSTGPSAKKPSTKGPSIKVSRPSIKKRTPEQNPIGLQYRSFGDIQEIDPKYFYPTLFELNRAHSIIRPDRNDNDRIPYGHRYQVALKASEQNLICLECLEDECRNAGKPAEQIQSNVERWLEGWKM